MVVLIVIIHIYRKQNNIHQYYNEEVEDVAWDFQSMDWIKLVLPLPLLPYTVTYFVVLVVQHVSNNFSSCSFSLMRP